MKSLGTFELDYFILINTLCISINKYLYLFNHENMPSIHKIKYIYLNIFT